jgi:hypothetical protein
MGTGWFTPAILASFKAGAIGNTRYFCSRVFFVNTGEYIGEFLRGVVTLGIADS